MSWNTISFVKLFLKYWKKKKRVTVGKPTALKAELAEKKAALLAKRIAKDEKDKKDKKDKK